MNNLGWQAVASFRFQTSCPLLEQLGGTFLISISHTCFCREKVGVITEKKIPVRQGRHYPSTYYLKKKKKRKEAWNDFLTQTTALAVAVLED